MQHKSILFAKRFVILVLLFGFCIGLTACKRGVDVIDAQGHEIRMSDYRGKWVVINYWATWCKPCLTELPELNALYHTHVDKVVVLGVSFDGLPNAQIREFAASLKLDFPMLSQFPIARWGVNDIPSLPVTFILDPHGKLTQTLFGPQTQQSLLSALEQQ